MQCPKCESSLEEKKYGGQITIQSCSGCGGILTDKKTLAKMRNEWMADTVLDSNDHERGKETNKINEIDCPSCSKLMDKIFDEEQAHVWMEYCAACDLLFLDAGELTDLSDFTVMERIKNFLS